MTVLGIGIVGAIVIAATVTQTEKHFGQVVWMAILMLSFPRAIDHAPISALWPECEVQHGAKRPLWDADVLDAWLHHLLVSLVGDLRVVHAPG